MTDNQSQMNNARVPFEPTDEVISVKSWIGTLLLMAIPIVNLVMLFIWAFGSGTNPNRKHFARAYLIWSLIGIAIYLVLLLLFGAALFAAFNQASPFGYSSI